MPFDGVDRIDDVQKTPFDRMAEERHKKATEEALDAEVIDEVDNELETLNMENIEHLQTFMEAAEDAYMDAMRWEWSAYHENYQSLTFDDIEGREVFEVLRDMLDEIRGTIDTLQNTNPPEGGYTAEHQVPITHDQVEHLQELYDKILLFRDTVEHAYAAKDVALVREEVIEPEPLSPEPEPEKQHDTIDGVAEDVTPNDDEVSARWSSESAPRPESSMQSEKVEVPTEELLKELKEVIEPVHQDQFLTDIERETVRALEQQFGRQVEAGESEKAKQTIDNLRSIIESQTVNVNPELIAERTKRILERVEAAKSGNPDVYMTANSLAENITRIKEETGDDDRVRNAYQNLERHALDHEDEWLTVCGMHVPKAGPDGKFGARSFREGLMLSLDRHPALVASPQRKMMVGKIVSMLRTVPDTGLTEAQVTEIKRLARIIDSPKRLIEARQSGPANATPFDIPKPLEEDIVSPKRGDLKIESADTEESIEIQVAEGAEQYIANPEAEEVVPENEPQPTKVKTIRGVIVPVGGDAEPEVVRHSRAGLIALADKWGNEYPALGHKQALEEMIRIMQFAPKDRLSAEQTARLSELAEILNTVEESEVEQSADTEEETTVPIVTEADVESDTAHGFVSELEAEDPINEVIEPDVVPQAVPESYRFQETERSLTRSYLFDARYSAFIGEHYGTPEKFERFLQNEIARIDKSANDAFAEWLGETHASAFGFLEDMSIDQVRALSALPNAELREKLKQENVKYESYIAWMDVINDLMGYAGANPDMRIGELIARGMIEVEMTYYEGGADATQWN